MKLAGVLFIAGIVLGGIGACLMYFSEDIELKGDEVLVVPSGLDGYAYIEVDMGTGGPITGTYECLNGTYVQVSVMDDGQFDEFLSGLGLDSRTSVLGVSGAFAVEQVDMEICYIVVQHAAGVVVEQVVSVDYTVTNTDLSMFLSSTVIFVAGGAMVTVAFHPRVRKKAGAGPPVNVPIDVVFFDE